MRITKAAVLAGLVTLPMVAACTDAAGGSRSSDPAAQSLCQQLPAGEVLSLFDVGSTPDKNPADSKVTTEADTSSANPGCKWLTGEGALGITVVTVAGGRERLTSISTGPVDVGDGVELFPPKQTDAMCQAEFTSRGGPTDQALTVIVLPDLQLTRPSNRSVDWCQRAAPAAKTVMKGIGWLR